MRDMMTNEVIDRQAPYIMVVDSIFYPDIAEELYRGAVAELEAAGAIHKRFRVPGAFELPAAIRYSVRAMEFMPMERRRFDGYVALGCVLRGETVNFDLITREVTRGLMELSITHTLALGYGVLACENEDQAWERASTSKRNLGGEAAHTCLDMLKLKAEFKLYPRAPLPADTRPAAAPILV